MEQNYRDEMREKLILATINRIEISGTSGVHARDLASEVGCAVGTIYNLVGDLDNLILLVCERTLEEYQVFVTDHFQEQRTNGATNLQLLEALGASYVDFSSLHRLRWQAIFEVRYKEDSDFHQIYATGQRQLLRLITDVLADISAGVDEKELADIGRALWASVHGITMLAVTNPRGALPREKILAQCNLIIHPVVKSLEIRAKAKT
ncbi:MAG: TetR-like C-terminal domain-containing protein [Hyphomicrobiales bacterium]